MQYTILSSVMKEPGRTDDYPPLWVFACIFDDKGSRWGSFYHVLKSYNQTESNAVRLLLGTQLLKKLYRPEDTYRLFIMSPGEKAAYEGISQRAREDNWHTSEGQPIPNMEHWKAIAEEKPADAKIEFIDTFSLEPVFTEALRNMNRGAEAFLAMMTNPYSGFKKAKLSGDSNITIPGYQKDTGTIEPNARKGPQRVYELVVRSLKKDGEDLPHDKINWFDLLAAAQLAEELLEK